MAATTNHAAVISKPPARVEVQARPVPVPGPKELVVRSKAVAINPVDWKIQEFDIIVTKWPNVLGSDVAGEVVSVGSEVTKFKAGDRVLGFAGSIYDGNIDHGASQEYVVIPELATTQIPSNVDFTAASVFPMAVATSGMALFIDLGVPRDGYPAGKGPAVLVWGASSSVGMMTVQIAHDRGLKVFGIASAAHHAKLKSLGATHLFDYHDSNVVDNVVNAAKAAGTPINWAYDTISLEDTVGKVLEILSRSSDSQKKMAYTLPWPEEIPQKPDVVYNETRAWYHSTEYPEFGAWLFNDYLGKKLTEGVFKPVPEPTVIEGGVSKIQEGYDMNKAGVSGTKVVVKF